ncbi:MAG: hypothetical protein C4589_11675 [Peptococcaceae bacterium]|nr:MAG: hypothetical protein C4589_11675 [Peptococcaceae bacterium]
MIHEVNCRTGKVIVREETKEEQEQRERDMLAAQPKPENLVAEILATLENAFWQFTKQFTGEPEITQLKLKNWDDKYLLAQHWALNGKPDVTKNSETYAMVIREAAKRTDVLQDPNLLIDLWLKNGYVWKAVLDWYYFDYEPLVRGQAYAAQKAGASEALQGILEGLEERLVLAAMEYISVAQKPHPVS